MESVCRGNLTAGSNPALSAKFPFPHVPARLNSSRVRLRKPRRIGRLSGFPGLDDTSGLLRYTPSADYFGTDTFAYTVVDPLEASASGAVIVEVTPVPDPPVVSLMADPLAGSTPLLVHFAAAASDPDQDTPTYSWDFGDGETAPNGARITLTFAF